MEYEARTPVLVLTGKGRPVRSMALLVDDLMVDHIVNASDIAGVTGSKARTVTRWRQGASPRRVAEERLLELKAVVDLLRRALRDEPARLWIRSPDPDLSYEKPLDLIERGEYRKVIGVILSITEGVTA